MWGVPRVPGYTGRASRVSGFEASDFFCCVAFLSIDGIAPKAVLSGVTQVDPFAHLGKASELILSRWDGASCWIHGRWACLPDVWVDAEGSLAQLSLLVIATHQKGRLVRWPPQDLNRP